MKALQANQLNKLDIRFLSLVSANKSNYNLVMALSSHMEANPVEATLHFCAANGDYGLLEKNEKGSPIDFVSLMDNHSDEVCDFLVGYADMLGILKKEKNKHVKVMKLLESETDILTSNSQISVAKAFFDEEKGSAVTKSNIVDYVQTCLITTLEQQITKSGEQNSLNDWLMKMLQIAKKLKASNEDKRSRKNSSFRLLIEPIPAIVNLTNIVGVEAVLSTLDGDLDTSNAYIVDKEFNSLDIERLKPLYDSLRASLDTQNNDCRKKIISIADAEANNVLLHCSEPITLAYSLEPSIDIKVFLNSVNKRNYPEKSGDKALDDTLCVLAAVSAQISLNRAKKCIDS